MASAGASKASGIAEARLERIEGRSVQGAARCVPRHRFYEMEKQLIAWNAEKGVMPDSYTAALSGFIK